MELLNLSGRRRLTLIRQSEAAECGLACLTMVADFYGKEIDLATMRRRFNLSLKGMTLRTMIDVASALDLDGRPIRCELEELANLRQPAILHWGTNHFVVLNTITKAGLVIFDPAFGRLNVSMAEASRLFTGVALELSPRQSFTKKKERSKLKLGSLISFEGGIRGAIGQAVVLSLIIEGLVLAAPFYLQFVVDEAILKGDQNLLNVLALTFCLLVVFRVTCTTLRGLTTQYTSNVLAYNMKKGIFDHLLRLPLEWFHKRQIGDIQSRFWALRNIQAFISQGALTGILDGILGITILILMFAYSATLAFVVVASMALFALVKVGSFAISKRYAADAIMTDAKEQTRFLETLRAAQTIKAAGSENVRGNQYGSSAAKSINSQIRSGNVQVAYLASEQLINGITDVLVIFLGAKSVIAGDLTVGMLTAFLAYKAQFVIRSINMLEQLFAWRLLDLQLERISDITLTEKDPHIDDGGVAGQIVGRVECKGLGFRYAFGEPIILRNVNFVIQPGECVAIVGASGCGKSTLAKILTGLYEASAGDVFIDDKPLKHWNNRSLRSQISYVSQEDQLLAGSIAENIAFFDDSIDLNRVIECAKTVLIHDEIAQMPMGFESLVGDMGSSLSGGQKQRVLLARALYRRPRILVLDEATAHLDVTNEREISAALAALTITRIIIAHRPETIRSADRVMVVDGESVVPESKAFSHVLHSGTQ